MNKQEFRRKNKKHFHNHKAPDVVCETNIDEDVEDYGLKTQIDTQNNKLSILYAILATVAIGVAYIFYNWR